MQSQILAKACIDREKVLRLKWFRKNEENLELLATRPNIRKVSSQTLEKYDKLREDLAHQDRNVRRKMQDVLIEYEGAKYNVMKPVDPNVTQIIYKGKKKSYFFPNFNWTCMALNQTLWGMVESNTWKNARNQSRRSATTFRNVPVSCTVGRCGTTPLITR